MVLTPYVTISDIDRHYSYGPDPSYLESLIKTYDLHELVEEDLTAKRTQDKIDVYDNCLFVVLHFPKYRTDLNKYLINEFNIIIGSNYLITLTSYKTNHIEKVKDEYVREIETLDEDEAYKRSPYYILYRIIDAMYDKVLHALLMFSQDLRVMEDAVFEETWINKLMLEKIMVKRRNIVTLKHMLLSQEEILQEMHKEVLKSLGEQRKELDLYVEDLEYKLWRIMTSIEITAEDVDSLYNTYSALLNMRINSIITVLTIFTAMIGMMTLVTGFYWMNITLPGAQYAYASVYILCGMIIIVWLMLFVFKKNKRI